MSTPTNQLIRRGTELKDGLREKRIEIDSLNPRFPLLQRFARQKFVVPHGAFLMPIDVEALPLRAHLHGSDDTVEVYPEYQLKGVVAEGGKRLAEVLLSQAEGYDKQIHTLRSVLDGLFRRFVGHQPRAEALEKIARSGTEEYAKLKQFIADETGLDADWNLQPEPKVAAWLARLREEGSRPRTIKYNSWVAAAEFELTFSLRVVRASIPHLDALQLRARRGLMPMPEFDALENEIRAITNPAFSADLMGENVWNSDVLQELSNDGFSTVVSNRLAKLFGYVVEFSNFAALPNATYKAILADTSSLSRLKADFDAVSRELSNLKTKRQANRDLLGRSNPEVIRLNEEITELEKEVEQAAEKYQLSGREDLKRARGTARSSPDESLRNKFIHALTLGGGGSAGTLPGHAN